MDPQLTDLHETVWNFSRSLDSDPANTASGSSKHKFHRAGGLELLRVFETDVFRQRDEKSRNYGLLNGTTFSPAGMKWTMRKYSFERDLSTKFMSRRALMVNTCDFLPIIWTAVPAVFRLPASAYEPHSLTATTSSSRPCNTLFWIQVGKIHKPRHRL